MDPSYDKDFDSFSSGGTEAGATQVYGAVVGASSAGASRVETRPQVPLNSAAGGDIILVQPEKKKPKKWLLFVVLGSIVLCIGVFAFLIMKQFGLFDSKVTKTFNEYANHLLYGKDSIEKIGSDSGLDYLYYFDKVDLAFAENEQQEEEIKNYYRSLEKDLSNFIGVGDKMFDEETKSYINEYRDAAISYFQMKQLYFIDEEVVRSFYLEDGYKKVVEFLGNYYKPLLESEYSVAKNMGRSFYKTSLYYLDEFNAYHEAGCTDGVSIMYQCQNEVSFNVETGVFELESAIRIIKENTRRKVLEGCFEINEKIK